MTTPKRYEARPFEAEARDVVRKIDGWQPSPFDPVDYDLAVQDVAAAIRSAVKAGQALALDQAFDAWCNDPARFRKAIERLRKRLDSGEDL